MRLVFSSRFERELRKLTKNNPVKKRKIEKAVTLLRRNPHHPSLRLHKLTESNVYSLSVDMSIRITCHWEDDTVLLLEIGSHEEVY